MSVLIPHLEGSITPSKPAAVAKSPAKSENEACVRVAMNILSDLSDLD